MLQAETLFRSTLRLFFWGMVVTFGVLIVEHQFGVSSPPFLQMVWRGVMIAMIMIPALVLSSYVVICFALAIVALWKVYRPRVR
jgi:hypothetical protein